MKEQILKIRNKRYLALHYSGDTVPKATVVRSVAECFFRYLYSRNFKEIDIINSEQNSYRDFIAKAYNSVSATRLDGIDGVCFTQNPKSILRKFNNNRIQLCQYINTSVLWHIVNKIKSTFSWLRTISWIFIFMIAIIAFASIHSLKESIELRDHIEESCTLSSQFTSLYAFLIGSHGEVIDEDLWNQSSPESIYFSTISNMTGRVVSPRFDATVFITTLIALVCFIKLLTYVGSGFANINMIIQEKIAKIVQLDEDAQLYFSNLGRPTVFMHEGIEYFSYDIDQIRG